MQKCTLRYVEWVKSIQYSQLRISTQNMTPNTRIPYHDTTIKRYTYLGNISCQRIGLDALTLHFIIIKDHPLGMELERIACLIF